MIWSDPLVTPTAPESPTVALNTTGTMPDTATYEREPVEPVLDVKHRTISAGDQAVSVPATFDRPRPLRALYARLTGNGLTRTLLVPETQPDIDREGNAGVMRPRQMNTPYEVHQPGPWYESFLQQL